jgi:hypothetical protein
MATHRPADPLWVWCEPDDFEVTGPAVVHLAPVVPLSLDDLVAALASAGLTTDEVATLGDAGIRYQIAFVLAADGAPVVHHAALIASGTRPPTGEQLFRQLCRARVITAFGLNASANGHEPTSRPEAVPRGDP